MERCSEETARIFGADPRTFAPTVEQWLALVHPDDREPTHAAMNEARSQSKTYEVEYRVLLPSGETRMVQELGEPIFDDSGDLVQTVGTIQDITEHARLEEHLRHAQKLEAIGQLTGGMAHEFNNMLQGIVGYLELLRTRIDDRDEVRRIVEEVDAIAWHGAEITRSLLAFARKQSLEPRPIDVSAAVVEVSRVLRGVLTEDISVAISIEGDVGLAIADPNQLQSALLNLAINARDAMPEGGLITLEAGNAGVVEDQIASFGLMGPDDEVRPGNYVRLRVKDNGQGMPSAVQAHAFDPFFTTKEVGQGTGLGLSMVYGFATQSKGFVDIKSEVGSGTQVDLYLPTDAGEEVNKDDEGIVRQAV
jgi:signal transduction histidine kinase